MRRLKRVLQYRIWLMAVLLVLAIMPGIALGFGDPDQWFFDSSGSGYGPVRADTSGLAVVPPVALAGPDQRVVPGDFVQLDGTASTGDTLQFNWVQIAGPPVQLFDANTAAPFFFFPVDGRVVVTFQLTASNSAGTSTDTVNIIPRIFVPPPSLKTVPVPEPDNLFDFVRDKDAAIKLGKALFWDMQVGSDGIQSCASCHFNAGTDNRFKNQLSPSGAPPATDPTATFEVGGPNAGPNYTVTPDDFPFHLLADPFDRNSVVLRDSDDVVGPQGVFAANLTDIVPGSAEESCSGVPDPVFHVGATNVRRVEPRNTPSVINAVFNVRNFLDGRANFVFNGVNPFGARDPNAFILGVQPSGAVVTTTVRIQKASLASQAVGPPGSGFEMSCGGRPFAKIGKKLRSLTPLAKQIVHPNDSVLGTLIHPSGKGLAATYDQMIQAAVWPKYWNSSQLFDVNLNVVGAGTPGSTDEYTLMEANFSLFFGLAIQLYEATLVSDDAPYDRFQEGDATALTAEQQHGLDVFVNQGLCMICHDGAEFTGASISQLLPRDVERQEEAIERMIMGDGLPASYDNGFYNIGVRPTGEDLGVGGVDPFGNPLSLTRLAQMGIDIGPPVFFPPVVLNRAAVDGAFKVPSLRNVELTGPYFHNGGQGSLEQVVDFYVRGGDFREQNIDNLDVFIRVLPLTDPDRAALVAFLKSLTDDRVRFQRAPFDHPQLFVPNGHPGDQTSVTDDGTGKATDHLLEIPAVGAAGGQEVKPYFHGSVRLTNTVDKPIVRPNDTVEFTIQVDNTGNIDLKNVVVVDPLCTLSGPTGDSSDIGVLDVGETWTYTCLITMTQNIVNTATVSVADAFFEPSFSTTEASAEVVVDTSGPTNVTLLSFSATESDSDVALHWETITEIDNLGFNVWRSDRPDDGYDRVTSRLIPAQAAGPGGAVYEFVDHDVSDGTWYYKLETISFAGETDGWHGPVSLRMGDIQMRPLYLPLVTH